MNESINDAENNAKKIKKELDPSGKLVEKFKGDAAKERVEQEDWTVNDPMINDESVENGVAERYDKDEVGDSHYDKHYPNYHGSDEHRKAED